MSKKTVISKIRAHINSSVDPQKEMNEFKDMLSELAKEKKRKCVKKNKDGASYFDYYEMAKMIHDGEW